MTATITLEYTSEHGTINSLWAAARQHGFVPEIVHVLTPDPDGPRAERLRTMLGAVQAALGVAEDVRPERIDPEDLKGTRHLVQQLIKSRTREGRKVAVDVTAGRTIPKLALFQACVGDEAKPEHVFYLSVPDYDYRPAPYPLIPRRLQTSRDLIGEVATGG